MKPLFTHDCEKCKFLGNVTTVNGLADVYYSCDSYKLLDTPNVIFRYSSDPPDYSHVGTDRMGYLFKFDFVH